MVRLQWVWLLSLTSLLGGQDFSRLPEWAAVVAKAASQASAPVGADAWVLLDRTEIAYTGENEIRQRRFRLVKVLSEKGLHHGIYVLRGLGGGASKVKKLKGWNLRPDKDLAKLDSDNVVSFNDASDSDFSMDTATGAALERVVIGSLVAFESLESIKNPIGPISRVAPMEADPVRRWELSVAKREGWFSNLQTVGILMEKRHFQPWFPTADVEEVPGVSLAISRIPALPRDEDAHPPYLNILPTVRVRFLDPNLPVATVWGSWDQVGQWTNSQFHPRIAQTGLTETSGKLGLTGLQALWSWMGRTCVYRQVYLTPERGWVPESAVEVFRKRYGDCKDLSCLFISEAKSMGFKGVPALASIGSGRLETDGSPYPIFNHVIAALELKTSLGLPSEVATPAGRFLLVDPTDPLTPLGHLGEAHRGGRILICSETRSHWVDIPVEAILPMRIELEIQGEARPGGNLNAELTLRESGDVWGLRSSARRSDLKELRDRLAAKFDLTPTGKLEVVKAADPLDLSKPFEVSIRVQEPRGIRQQGGELSLVGWGIPIPAAQIQKAGVPRALPVSIHRSGSIRYRARIIVPAAVSPVLPSRKVETAFRTISWSVEPRSEDGNTVLNLAFDHVYKDADYSFEFRERGLQDWKKDRNELKSFREDAFAFRLVN